MDKKIIIIGGGLTGLCAGCYLQMNGYHTEIFELSSNPGGVCTSWSRSGYIFDGCIHWLVGSSPNDKFYFMWDELIDMNKIRFIDYDYYIRVEDKKGGFVNLYTDAEKLKEELLSKSPADKEHIEEFIYAVKKFSKLDMPIDKPQELYNLLDGIKTGVKFVPYLKLFRKWDSISANQFASEFHNPLLKNALRVGPKEDLTALFMVMMYAWFNKKSAGYPLGGSLKFVRHFEKRYLEEDGKIHYNSRVVKIITKNNKATGIETENGEKHHADIIVSAGDGYNAIFELLEGKYIDDKIINIYDTYKTFPSYLQVSLGVGRDFSSEPHYLYFPVDNEIEVSPDVKYDSLNLRIFNFDKTMAPENKTSMYAMFVTPDYKFWTDLRKNDFAKYQAEKFRIAEQVVDSIDKRFGNVKQYVEVVDVATPATFIRYTNNWKGSYEGWLPVKGLGFKSLKRTLPGLKNFYMAGQWIEVGGGLPSCILSARNVAQIICKNEGREFFTK